VKCRRRGKGIEERGKRGDEGIAWEGFYQK
jgi:hypothetical protein